MISVIWNRPSVIAGRIRAFSPEVVSKPVVQKPMRMTSPRPNEGRTPSVTGNRKINRMPIKNVGSEMPISDAARKMFDSHERRCSAVYTPIGMPISSEKIADAIASSMVAGKRSAIRSITGVLN